MTEFNTTAQQQGGPVVPSQENLEKLAEDNIPEVLRLVQQNRKSGLEGLQKRIDNLDKDLERGNLSATLENSLREMKSGLTAVLTNMEAENSLVDMVCHDLGGLVYKIQMTQKALQVSNNHLQTLLELLKTKELITDTEMEAMWNTLVKEKTKEVKEELATESNSEPVEGVSETK